MSRKRKARLMKLFVRKTFHFLLVAVVATGYITGAYAFTALALCGILWILVFFEYLRVSWVLPTVSTHLTAFFSRFVDCRDKNGLFLTHIYLLLGVALPFVTAVAQINHTTAAASIMPAYTGDMTCNLPNKNLPVYSLQLQSPEFQQRTTSFSSAACVTNGNVVDLRAAVPETSLSGAVTGSFTEAISAGHAFEDNPAQTTFFPTMISMQSLLGLLLVGIGDAVAALVGVKWGSKKVPLTKSKTYLGAAAFFAAPALLLMLSLNITRTSVAEQWLFFCAGIYAVALSTLFEAYTPDIDNCILSLFGVVAYNGALSFTQGWNSLRGENY